MEASVRSALPFLRRELPRLKRDFVPLWHPLGFVSCIIYEESKFLTIRVHYWPPGKRRVKNPDWPIHTHCYDLSSLILLGCVQDIQYGTRTGDSYTVYNVNYYEGGSEIVDTRSNISLVETVNETRVAGEQYVVNRGIYHQTLVQKNECAVTVVVLSNFSEEAPKVLGTSAAVRYPYDRRPFDKYCFWGAVTRALEATVPE